MSETGEPPALPSYCADAQDQRLYLFSKVVRAADVARLPAGADRSGLHEGVVVMIVDEATMWVRWAALWPNDTELMTAPEVLRHDPHKRG